MKKEQAEALKSQGNECMKNGSPSEAILHYTHAIQIDKNNHLLYSNRSVAFLKMQQYYYAMEDAREAIKLQPNWPKGYYRKGEVEFSVGNYTHAMMSYKQAFLLDPAEEGIKTAINKTAKEINNLRRSERRKPWMYGGMGFVLGISIVLADQFLTEKPAVQNLILQLLLVFVFTGIGFLVLKIYKFLQDSNKDSLLEPPVDLLGELGNSDAKEEEAEKREDVQENKPHRRGGAGAGRHRFKMGKS